MGETLKHWLRRYLDEGGVIPEWANFVAVLPGESVVWAEKALDFEITESETRFDSKGGLVSATDKGGPWTGAPEVLDLNEFWSDELSPKLDFPEQKPAVPEGTPASDHKPLPVGWFQWSPATRGRNLIDTATKAHRQGQINRARLEVILELVGAPTFSRIQYCEYLQTKARLALDIPLDIPLDSVMLEQKAFSEIKRYWESLRDEGEYKSPEPPSDLPCPPKTESPFSVEPGYERLAAVFQDAHDQAALGKGKDRHANGEPFHEQRMQKVSRTQGNAYGMAFQVQKKMLEGLEMADREACRRELLGALNYLAGIVIFLDDQEAGGDE